MQQLKDSICTAETATSRKTARPVTSDQARWIRHAVELAVGNSIDIYWLQPKSAAANLIGDGIAQSFTRKRQVITPAIATRDDYLSALHEIGHIVASIRTKNTIEIEVECWRFAAVEALDGWGANDQALVAPSLRTYMTVADRRFDSVALWQAERFLGDEGLADIQRLRLDKQERQEDARFKAKHGAVPCQATACLSHPRGVAHRVRGWLLLCHACTTDADIARHRRERARRIERAAIVRKLEADREFEAFVELRRRKRAQRERTA